jgi:hypothetical protein
VDVRYYDIHMKLYRSDRTLFFFQVSSSGSQPTTHSPTLGTDTRILNTSDTVSKTVSPHPRMTLSSPRAGPPSSARDHALPRKVHATKTQRPLSGPDFPRSRKGAMAFIWYGLLHNARQGSGNGNRKVKMKIALNGI